MFLFVEVPLLFIEGAGIPLQYLACEMNMIGQKWLHGLNEMQVQSSTGAADSEPPAWAPLRDNYMLTNSKLKDWDKMQVSSLSRYVHVQMHVYCALMFLWLSLNIADVCIVVSSIFISPIWWECISNLKPNCRNQVNQKISGEDRKIAVRTMINCLGLHKHYFRENQ